MFYSEVNSKKETCLPPRTEVGGFRRGEPMISEKREQAAKQLEAVAHLATVLAGISSDLVKVCRDPACEGPNELVELVGNRTARQMEILGDMLNGMDAVTEEDEWLTPIYETAHRLWPQTHPGVARPTA